MILRFPKSDSRDVLQTVESRCGAVALGLACLFPSLSFDGALVTLP